ncbi:hypothetical protein B0H14DRAFT_2972608, partial [Mycena olivaceomarginata]
MCDTSNILQSSALFWTLSLIPSRIFPYLALGVLSASSGIYALYQHIPSARLGQINNAVAIVDETLTHVKAKCMWDYLVLLVVSRLHSCLLEMRNIPDWKNYLCVMVTILCALVMLECGVWDIQTSLLVLIEAAHQHKLTEDIHESQEIGVVYCTQYSGHARVHGQPRVP